MTTFLLGGSAGAPLASIVDSVHRDRKRRNDSLQSYERTIKLRLQEIEGVLSRIQIIRGRLAAAAGQDLQRVEAVLQSAERAYPEHRDRYRLKLFEIDLVRWQNGLEPLGMGSDGLTFEQCERHLDDLGILQMRLEELAAQWAGAELGSAAAGEIRRRLARSLALCGEVRQSLITRQALTVVSGVQALAAEPSPGLDAGVDAGLDRMAARAELGEFVQGLSALEAEHARLEAELEVNRLGRS